MKPGIAGTGMIVREFLSVANKGVMPLEEIYLYGRNRKSVDELTADYDVFPYYDYNHLLDSDVDAVYVALPNSLHASFGRQALEAGKHVIMEKPITANYAEFQDLAELARKKNLLLMEAMTVHYLSPYGRIKQTLSELGKIHMVTASYCQYSSRYDRFQAGEVIPAFDPAQAGGALMDLNVYNLHFVVGLFGAPLSVSYSANVQRGIDTSGVMVLEYPDFKAVCVGAKDCAGPSITSIHGEKGSLVLSEPCNQMTFYQRHDRAGRERKVVFYDTPEEKLPHRMVNEFRSFDWMIRCHDREFCQKMLDISGTVVRIMEEGRKQAGIVFPCDKQ